MVRHSAGTVLILEVMYASAWSFWTAKVFFVDLHPAKICVVIPEGIEVATICIADSVKLVFRPIAPKLDIDAVFGLMLRPAKLRSGKRCIIVGLDDPGVVLQISRRHVHVLDRDIRCCS